MATQNVCTQALNHILIWQTLAFLSLVGQMSLVRVLCFSLLLLVVPPCVVAAADSPDALRVLHRIYHPSRPSEPFTDRGALILTRSGPAVAAPHTTARAVGGAHLVPHEALPQDLVGLEQTFQSIVDDLATKGLSATKASQEVLYQLALEHPGDTHHSQWHVSSVKAVSLLTTFTIESMFPTLHRAAQSVVELTCLANRNTTFIIFFLDLPRAHTSGYTNVYTPHSSATSPKVRLKM